MCDCTRIYTIETTDCVTCWTLMALSNITLFLDKGHSLPFLNGQRVPFVNTYSIQQYILNINDNVSALKSTFN